ncbi:Hypothetical predicted protein, partial [Paramuricea clavata]
HKTHVKTTQRSPALGHYLRCPLTRIAQLANTSEEPKVIRANISEVIDIDRFGNLKKLLRVTAYVLRFVNALKKAEIMWLCSVQELSFAKESEFPQRNVQKSPPQYVTQFGLYTGESHVIRCKGRLDNSSLGLGSRHPILLPSKHRFVELLIREVNEQVKHNGIRDTLTTARERFWIIRGREAVKRITKDCVVCRKAEGLPYNYGQAPDLPSCRVSDDPPFTNVGLDFAGPLYVQDKKNELDENSNKVYVLLFTCASACKEIRRLCRAEELRGDFGITNNYSSDLRNNGEMNICCHYANIPKVEELQSGDDGVKYDSCQTIRKRFVNKEQ